MAEKSGGPYVMVRVEPRNWGDLKKMGGHGRRTFGDTRHCDPEKTALNRFGTPLEGMDPRYPERCTRALFAAREAKVRTNTTRICAHLLYAASPSFFGLCETNDVPDPEKVNLFLSTVLEQVGREFPGMLASWRLDLDELAAPHVDIFLTPMVERVSKGGKLSTWISYNEHFGEGSAAFIEMQTRLCADFAPLGLKRGQSKAESHARHLTPREMRTEMARSVEEARRDRGEIAVELVAARAARVEAEEKLDEVRGILKLAKEIAGLAGSMLPYLLGQGQKIRSSLVSGIDRLNQMVKRASGGSDDPLGIEK